MDKIIIAVLVGIVLLFAYRRVRGFGSSLRESFREGKARPDES